MTRISAFFKVNLESIVKFCKFLAILNYSYILHCGKISFIFYVGSVLDRDNL